MLALIAILPEYAIEAALAWKAGASYDPVLAASTPQMGLVAANVTGSNRLLIGLGWPVVILIFWAKRHKTLYLRGHISLELIMLIAATAATFLIFYMEQVHLAVAGALIALYILYLWLSSRKEQELMGTAALIGSLPARQRRGAVVLLFLYSAAVILVAAEPFVDSLVETGEKLGIDQFILIQWIAPLASESPEIIVAALFSLRLNPQAGLTTVISAQVNQLTILIGSMAFIFSLSAGQLLSFPLESRQLVEFLLTSSVSVFAIVLIAPRLLGWKSGAVLLGLFIVHLPFTDVDSRQYFALLYLGLSAGLLLWNLRQVRERIDPTI